ncbi:MAG TPA: hypothetical protein VI583_13435, partial [Cyclobacteriaceae bacterium]|nr:hypothetical protein [Cyclobacteriaceae bacterium]
MKSIISLLIRKIPRKHLQKISHIFFHFLKVFYAGNRVECPICGNQFRSFFPYGRNPVRENALC